MSRKEEEKIVNKPIENGGRISDHLVPVFDPMAGLTSEEQPVTTIPEYAICTAMWHFSHY